MDKIHYTINRIKPLTRAEISMGSNINNHMSHIDGLCNYNPSMSWNNLSTDKRAEGEFPNCKRCLKKYLDKVNFKNKEDILACVKYIKGKITITIENNPNLNIEFKEIKEAESYLKENGFVEHIKK